MDPVSIARIAREAADAAYTVGQVMFELWQGHGEAGRDYETFSRDVNQLGHCCVMVSGFLLDPSRAFSEHILRPLHRILHDIMTILVDLRHALDQFCDGVGRHAKVIGVKLFRLVTTPEHERRKRLQKFPQRRRVGLQRSQIRYATSILNLVIAVAQHPQTREYERRQSSQFNTEDSLLREVHRAKRAVETLEQRPEGWTVTATCWIHALPSRPDGHRSPLDILADQWTTPESRRPRGVPKDGENIRAIRDLERMTAGLQQQITRLEDEVNKYRRGRQEDQEIIARLQAECASEEEARKQQRRRDAAVVRRLQADIATLTRAHKAQDADMQCLQKDCARLTGERDVARRDNVALQRIKYVEWDLCGTLRQLESQELERKQFKRELQRPQQWKPHK